MKKLIALLLVCFVMVNASFVYADTQSQEINNVLEAIKPRIPSTDEYDEFSSSVSDLNGKKQYHFTWSKNDDENGNYASMNVRVNSKGIITSFDFYNDKLHDYDNSVSIKRISSDEALKSAEEMLKKLNPDIAQTLKISKTQKNESLYARQFNFKVERYENSIPVIGNTGSISLSHDAKTLVSFYMNYDDIDFSNENNFISREEAIDSFYNNFKMTLKYADNYKDGDKKIVLQYEPEFDYGAYVNEYISAIDASVVKRDSTDEIYRFATSDSVANEKAMLAGGSSSLTEIEIKEIEKISGLLSIEDAEKLVRSNKVIDINKNYNLAQSRLNRDYENKDKYIYNLRFENSEEERIYTINVYLDASNGKIIRFYKNGKYSEEKNVTEAEALKKANETVKILAKEHFGEKPDFVLEEKEEYNGNYRYIRYVNDIVYDGNSVSVGINLADGSVDSYSIYYSDYDFPSTNEVISDKDACDKLFEQIDYSVKYLPMTSESKAVPVYASDANSFIVDAFSGKLMYPEESETILPYDDIKDHYAENAVNTLKKYGIGFEGGSFLPDKNITQKDFVALLTSAFSYRQPVVIKANLDYNEFYLNAKNNGIVKEGEYNPEKEITRMEAAVMLVRAIGAEKIAELEDIFVTVFSDVSENKGYVAILNAMNVISGDEYKNFNPSHNLSRADAAIMLYNYLSK